MYKVNIGKRRMSYTACRYIHETVTYFREYEIRDTVHYGTK
jgi:hypothetical protein